MKTELTIEGMTDIAPDIMLGKTNCYWGNHTICNLNDRHFSQKFGRGSLLTSYNTHHMHSHNPTAYPNILYGRVCQWIQPQLTPHATHIANDHLGWFAATRLLSLHGKAIMFITAYHPVKGQRDWGTLTVMVQHKRVLGTASDPQEEMLSDFLKLIVKIHQINLFVVLDIDTNEMCRQGGPTQHTEISKFCSY